MSTCTTTVAITPLQIHIAVAVVYLFLLFDGCRQKKIALVIVGTKPEVERAAVDVEATELSRHVARHHLVVLKHTDMLRHISKTLTTQYCTECQVKPTGVANDTRNLLITI